jgi:hypothetical protein
MMLNERSVAALALARRLGTSDLPHRNGRTLFDHLAGVATVAAAWKLPAHVCDAALFHSVYGTAVYRNAAAGVERRREVRSVVGDAAERLAFAFGSLDRTRFAAALATMESPRAVALTTRFGTVDALSPRDVTDLVLLGIVNEVEQHAAPDRSPANWRAACRPLVAAVERWNLTDLPAFVRGALAVSDADAERARTYYARGLEAAEADPRNAAATFRLAADSLLRVGEPLVWLARLCARAGDRDAAEVHAREARARLEAWGTPWDKRRTLAEWLEQASGEG